MQSYFVEIAAVRLAAVLMDQKNALRFPQYAFMGAIKRYGSLQAYGIVQTEGIDDLCEKADAFRFGQHCVRIMRIQHVKTGIDEQCAVLAGLFYSDTEPKEPEKVKQTIRALIRRAQLQTHTAKPGYEDINSWLEKYYVLSTQLPAFLDKASKKLSDPEFMKEKETFFSRTDPLIKKALDEEALNGENLEKVICTCTFGKLLRGICRKVDLTTPVVPKPYRIHPDFPERKEVTSEALEAVIHEKILHTEEIPGPIIIRSIEMRLCHGFCLLIVRTDAGIDGVSIAGDNWKYFYPILEKKMVPLLIGTDARDIEENLEKIYVRDLNYKIQGLAYWCCNSWIEASILDILGKAKSVPLGQLFGPRVRNEVEYYCASGNRGTAPLEEIEILAERIAEVGVRAIKFKIGGRMSWGKDSIPGRSEELIVLARRYFGDEMIIHADGNGSFGPEQAIKYGHLLQDINAYFYEEPCRFDYLWETKEVADAVEIPLAFGEQETSLRRFRWLIENNAAQVLQPDVQYLGGFIRTAKVAKMARLAGIPITAHISGGIQYANVLHLASFTENMGRYQELKVGYQETKDFFTTKLVLKDGKMNIPEGVGFGMVFEKNFIKNGQTIFIIEDRK